MCCSLLWLSDSLSAYPTLSLCPYVCLSLSVSVPLIICFRLSIAHSHTLSVCSLSVPVSLLAFLLSSILFLDFLAFRHTCFMTFLFLKRIFWLLTFPDFWPCYFSKRPFNLHVFNRISWHFIFTNTSWLSYFSETFWLSCLRWFILLLCFPTDLFHGLFNFLTSHRLQILLSDVFTTFYYLDISDHLVFSGYLLALEFSRCFQFLWSLLPSVG